jgi:NAD+ synthetase
MAQSLKIYLAQINNSVGDLEYNQRLITDQCLIAEQQNCDLIIFPEMTISGYPCEDLWKKKYFIKSCEDIIFSIIEFSKKINCAILLGSPTSDRQKNKEIIRNSALLIEQGKVKNIIHKKSLPNYSVFDEERYFTASSALSYIEFRNQTLAILICEDFWQKKNWLLINEQICDNILVINSSPFSIAKHDQRIENAQEFCKATKKSLLYVNQIGGQDSLVFDGGSFAIDAQGDIKLQMSNFEEDAVIITLSKDNQISLDKNFKNYSSNFVSNNSEQIYCAMTLSLRDYLQKNNFSQVLLGMSGGIDSALVATIAVDALGSDNVKLYALPTKFNSQNSMIDAQECAKNLRIELKVISIEEIFKQMLLTFEKNDEQISPLAQENLQSRIRGNILMSLSNSINALLLSTGNKSELACGYATIYGDMCGAFNPIKDLYKTQIYEITKWRNANICKLSRLKEKNLIPENILIKAPSAELRFDQKDSDSLPAYDILDQILFFLIEQEKSISQIVAEGFDYELVKKINRLLLTSEYKRKQSTLGAKLSTMSFDKERRYPITNKFYL